MPTNPIESYHPALFAYAYNILGSYEDAKDAVQDVTLNYLTTPRVNIANEKAYLIRSIINHSINMKKRYKRTSYPESWLPEPVETHGADHRMNSREILSYSLLVLLERLGPKERGVYILKHAFDYTHEEIAGTLELSVENSRKLLSRATRKLSGVRPQEQRSVLVNSDLLNNYIAIVRGGDIRALEKMLSDDIMAHADGGSKLSVVRELTAGPREVAHLMRHVFEKYQREFSIAYTFVNHQPALLFFNKLELVNCQIFEFDQDQKIKRIYSVVDPDKLKNLKLF
ncbi:sigma-70 family RNA polymerase sigma factor [Sphingobacterium sp. JB170]|uniref:sigma-70 family RNA polymerase sigma factor n=1 Tax=Sphingobacterium sp. JB170 TaxID=1434842 RepID=UPI00097ECADE|nr:sigma-70 family RNA polymerase sigma factor [Sphingobacterium sp. JB170]SJN28456.1 putative RNA polymerase sigma factor [Sphingobacterium sp. JB170]